MNGSGIGGLLLVMMIMLLYHPWIIVTMEDIGRNQGFHKSLTLFFNEYSSALQWVVNSS